MFAPACWGLEMEHSSQNTNFLFQVFSGVLAWHYVCPAVECAPVSIFLQNESDKWDMILHEQEVKPHFL